MILSTESWGFDMLPQDPFILLSWANTQLRDFFPSLEALCDDCGTPAEELTAKLAQIGYTYDPNINQFR